MVQELLSWDLPSDVVTKIFRKLSRRQVARASCVCQSWKRTASIAKTTAFLSRAVSKNGKGSGKKKMTSQTSFENLELIGDYMQKDGRMVKFKREKYSSQSSCENLDDVVVDLVNDMKSQQRKGDKDKGQMKNPDVRRIAVFKDVDFRQIHCMVPWKEDLVVVAGLVVPFEGFLEVWSLEERIMIKQLEGDLFGESCMAIRDDTLVCSGARGSIKVWDLESGERKMTLRGHHLPVNAVVDLGFFWATGSDDGTIRIWDTEHAYCKTTAHAQHAVTCLATNENRTIIVSGSDHKQIQVWCVESMACFYTLNVPDGVLSMASGCNMLFTGSCRGLQMWDFSEDVPTIFRKAGGGMEYINYVSVEGRQVITASADSVKVWDLDQSKRIRKINFRPGVSGALQWGDIMMVGTTLANAPLMFCDLV